MTALLALRNTLNVLLKLIRLIRFRGCRTTAPLTSSYIPGRSCRGEGRSCRGQGRSCRGQGRSCRQYWYAYLHTSYLRPCVVGIKIDHFFHLWGCPNLPQIRCPILRQSSFFTPWTFLGKLFPTSLLVLYHRFIKDEFSIDIQLSMVRKQKKSEFCSTLALG